MEKFRLGIYAFFLVGLIICVTACSKDKHHVIEGPPGEPIIGNCYPYDDEIIQCYIPGEVCYIFFGRYNVREIRCALVRP